MKKEVKIEVNRRTKLYAKVNPQKTLCHFNYKCKSRAAVVLSQKEIGRQPNDLGLCEEHAREMLEALQIMYGTKDVSVSEKALLNALEVLRLAEETMDRYEKLIELVLDSKDKKLTWTIVDHLLAQDNIKYDAPPNTRKGIDKYIAYHKPLDLRMEEAAAPEVEAEIDALDLNGADDDLLAKLARAAQEEGLGVEGLDELLEEGEEDAE